MLPSAVDTHLWHLGKDLRLERKFKAFFFTVENPSAGHPSADEVHAPKGSQDDLHHSLDYEMVIIFIVS